MIIKKTQVKKFNTTPKLSSIKTSPYKITPSKKQINSLIQKIQNKKVDAKGKSSIRLEFSQDDYNFLIELLKLSTKIGQLEKLIDVLDDEAEFHLNMIQGNLGLKEKILILLYWLMVSQLKESRVLQ